MYYEHYNANPFNNLSSDCTVRAISLLTNETWDDIYIDLSLQGFLMKAMPVENKVWGSYLYQLGYTKSVWSDKGFCPTVMEFTKNHPVGRFLLCTGTHVVPLVDGKYYDTWDSGDEIVDYYWKKETDYEQQ